MMTNSVIKELCVDKHTGKPVGVNKFLLAAGFVHKPAKLLYTDLQSHRFHLSVPAADDCDGYRRHENIDDGWKHRAWGAARMEGVHEEGHSP